MMARIVGIETEYGIFLEENQGATQEDISRKVIRAYIENLGLDKKYPHRLDPNYDWMLSNGARFYVDHGHPEYSTPECHSIKDLVAADKAGEIILLKAANLVSKQLPEKQRIIIFKNNIDHKAHSYGCHENYLLSVKLFHLLIDKHSRQLNTHLIPFLVTRQLYAGSGRVGSRDNQPGVSYQLSQRADFFESIIGVQTTHNRPIINTRDEPHADPARFRRFHVIIGDANMSETATFCKIGTTQLILQMLEDNYPLPKVPLSDPVAALHSISRDITLKETIELEDGRSILPIEIQQQFLHTTSEYIKEKNSGNRQKKILDIWAYFLKKLVRDQYHLFGHVDWITKKILIEKFIQKTESTWESPVIKEMDIKYHNINPGESLYYMLREQGLIKNFIDKEKIHFFTENPPKNTRASLRKKIMEEFSSSITHFDWSELQMKHKKVSLPDPCEYTLDKIKSLY